MGVRRGVVFEMDGGKGGGGGGPNTSTNYDLVYSVIKAA